jgi:hypothetical protein
MLAPPNRLAKMVNPLPYQIIGAAPQLGGKVQGCGHTRAGIDGSFDSRVSDAHAFGVVELQCAGYGRVSATVIGKVERITERRLICVMIRKMRAWAPVVRDMEQVSSS